VPEQVADEIDRAEADPVADPGRPGLAIPPELFPTIVDHLAASRCAEGARIVVEKPLGHDLASARALNGTLHNVFPEESIFRIDHYLGKEAVQNLFYFRFCNPFLSRSGTAPTSKASRSP
jgi:glucose-6-phosphate 1-dehydrogenase